MSDWSQPKEVSQVQMAFPAGLEASGLIPPWELVEAYDYPNEKGTWGALTARWFYSGLGKSYFSMKNGVDQEKAIRHLRTILGSFEPKHEHKIGAVNYLVEQWFSAVLVQEESGNWTAYTKEGQEQLTDEEVQELVNKSGKKG